MLFVKPAFVKHAVKSGGSDKVSHQAIFSVHIHPDGTRFATGGGDFKVRVWSLRPCRDEAAENDPNAPKQLASLSTDHGVNSVRFSPDGKLLAAACDDCIVLVYRLEPGRGHASFGSDEADIENWRTHKMLREHDADVNDIAWAPDSSRLASCSVDNRICVLDTRSWSVVARLEGHTNYVKGLAWDPIGTYLASQSDDKTLRVWRTRDWSEETLIKDAFVKSTGRTWFRRPSWSPDGQFLVVTHGLKSANHVAPIITRGDWQQVYDFVGHRKPVEVVAFNPVMFEVASDKDAQSLCAVGSQDHCISIWKTGAERPLVVCRDIFDSGVVDLSWSADGYTLLACSDDGSVAAILFDAGELGQPLNEARRSAQLARIYGDHADDPGAAMDVVEDPALAASLEQPAAQVPVDEAEAAPTPTDAVRPGTVPSTIAAAATAAAPAPASAVQSETRTSDGRRRVTPMLVSGNGNSNTAVPSAFSAAQPATQASAVQVLPVKRRAPDGTVVVDDGKRRRVAPTAVGTSTSTTTAVDAPTAAAPAASAAVNITVAGHTGAQTLALPPVQAARAVTFYDVIHEELTLELGQDGERAWLECRRDSLVLWKVWLPCTAVLLTGNREVCAVTDDVGNLWILSSAGGRRLVPRVALDGPAVYLKMCDDVSRRLITVTSTGKLRVWNLAVLGQDQTASATASSSTSSGTQQQQMMIHDYDLASILQPASPNTASADAAGARPAPRILSVDELPDGSPCVSLDTNHAWAFHPDLKAWVCLTEAFLHSDYQPDASTLGLRSPSSPASAIAPAGPLRRFQARMRAFAPKKTKMLAKDHTAEMQADTIAHLETQAGAAYTLQSASEYRYWMLTYVRYLTAIADEERLRTLLEELLGPVQEVDASAASDPWVPTVLGISKLELLRSFLPVIMKNLKLQRLVSEVRTNLDQKAAASDH